MRHAPPETTKANEPFSGSSLRIPPPGRSVLSFTVVTWNPFGITSVAVTPVGILTFMRRSSPLRRHELVISPNRER